MFMTQETLWKELPVRVSKLESFLRKNLRDKERAALRYYEVCVVEKKGTLQLRYIILTDESLLVTENPPRKILFSLTFSQIQDIQIVADRGSLIKETNGPYTSQHIRVEFEDVHLSTKYWSPAMSLGSSTLSYSLSSKESTKSFPQTLLLHCDPCAYELDGEVKGCEPIFSAKEYGTREQAWEADEELSQRNSDSSETSSKSGEEKKKFRMVLPKYFTRRKYKVSREKERKQFNFYLYQKNSYFLNELFLIWSRGILRRTLDVEEVCGGRGENHSLRAGQKILSRLSHRLLEKRVEKGKKFDSLYYLHKSLLKYSQLKRLFWQDPSLLPLLFKPFDEMREEELNEEAMLFPPLFFDILRILFEGLGASGLRADNQLDFILASIFSHPQNLMNKSEHSERIQRLISDPETYTKMEWMNDPSISLIVKLVSIGHNSSVGLLYEILNIVSLSPRENDRRGLVLLLNKYRLESYLKQSVTQVINLLWCSRRAMKGSQTVLLYRHLFVLRSLSNWIPSVKEFIQSFYTEEFQYFVGLKRVNMKIPDRFPVKSRLLTTSDQLRGEIIEKSDLPLPFSKGEPLK